MIKKTGSQYGVYSSSGRLLGKHKTKEEARAQLAAVEISKRRRQNRRRR